MCSKTTSSSDSFIIKFIIDISVFDYEINMILIFFSDLFKDGI